MPDDNRPLRFLHISDVFLDARLSFKGLGMSAPKRFESNQEAFEAFSRMLNVARLRQVDAVLVTGNLWEGQSVTAATASQLSDAFAQLGEMPVLIAPGIADPYTAQSLFNPKVLAAHGVRPWSRNVHIFSSDQYTLWRHPSRKDVCFFGRANLGLPGDRMQKPPVPAGEQLLRVLVDYQPLEQHGDEPLIQSVDYSAFGGCLNSKVLLNDQGDTMAAAPGSLIGRSIHELGLRAGLFVEIDYAKRPVKVRIERVPADHRQLISVAVSINGVKAPNVPEYIAKVVESSGARAGIDIVHVKLSGIYPPVQVPDIGEQQLRSLYFHAKVDNVTRPDYFIEKADQKTPAGRFIQTLQELKNKAEARGGILTGTEYGAILSAKEVEDALYFGLEALNQKKVTVPDVD